MSDTDYEVLQEAFNQLGFWYYEVEDDTYKYLQVNGKKRQTIFFVFNKDDTFEEVK